MKVSMDGLRKNMASAYSKAVEGFHGLDADTRWDREVAKEDLKEGLDNLRSAIAGFMCVYDGDGDKDFTNMADEADQLPWADPEDEDDE